MLSRERLQNRFIDMIRVYSPSKGEKEMADWIEHWLTERNIPSKSDHAGEAYGGNGRNIVAFVKGSTDERPLGFVAHMDQIEPCRDVHPVIDGKMIYTDHTTTLGGDDKAGISAILEAVEDVIESGFPHRDIYLVFTCSEEISMMGTKHMDMSMLPCKELVVVDATGGADVLAYKAPAMEAIEITVTGKKAHAGIAPEKGINAIVVASKAISRMHIGRIDHETTSNIGHIEGGTATNIVTDEVSFTAEIRSHSMEKLAAELQHMEQCCQEATEEMGAGYVLKHELAYPTLSLEEDCALIEDTVRAMAAEGITANKMIIGGGSDANVLAGHGYKSVILGCGMINVHTVEEALDTDEMWKTTKVLRRLMSEDQEMRA